MKPLTKQRHENRDGSDLTVAASWLTSGSLSGIPEGLKSAIEVAREAIGAGQVAEIRFLYCHNVTESDGVRREVDQAVASARQMLVQQYGPDASQIKVVGSEIGISVLGEISLRTSIPIAVKKEITLSVEGGFSQEQGKWKAFVTSLRGDEIRDLWLQHGELLTAPNVRDFLGLRRSDSNINNAIQETAIKDPENFWIYNNGLTVLVESYEYRKAKGRSATGQLILNGMGVINGAQTTGAIGTILGQDAAGLSSTRVLVRFVSSSDEVVLGNVIKYNNTQNKVEAPDFRSKDETQERLRKEFLPIPDAIYRGGRRSADGTAMQRPKNLLADKTVGQALAAFHGRPSLAYNETRLIWGDDAVYSSVFSSSTTAPHVVFAYGLLKATEEIKQDLRIKDASLLTASEKDQLEYFRMRGSIPLFVSAVGHVIETITSTVISDLHQASFGTQVSPKEAQERWLPIARALLSATKMLVPATESELKVADRVASATSAFRALVDMTASSNQDLYSTFGESVVLIPNPGH